ncbi:MAG: YcaQ family DNA glycosylase [Thermoleophilia bacterium]|nr:YcaQ family DNA glycosylase [Thermoleophilia bacterium]
MRPDDLRRHAVARTLFRPTTLPRAVARLGFVQADPIRAPARAQDLILRHRVAGYRAGDLEARYPRLRLEEDYLVNYGFMPRRVAGLMYPRAEHRPWTDEQRAEAAELHALVRRRRVVLPRDVETALRERTVTNAWGGRSNAVTHLLDAMHRRGMLRVHGRAGGQRRYGLPRHHPHDMDDAARADALLDVVVRLYAPLPSRTLTMLAAMLRWGAPGPFGPQGRAAAMARARDRLGQADVDGTRWYWPANEDPRSRRWRLDEDVRLLAPFDPIAWDRERFERLWGWRYRFEAYVPAEKRVMGYYALPVLWRGAMVGWCNASAAGGEVAGAFGHPGGEPPADPAFAVAARDELTRMGAFLGWGDAAAR